MTTILGIYRERLYSPGHAENDAFILQMVAEELRQAGHAVELAPFEAVGDRWRGAGLILSMCQGPSQVATLAAWQRRGAWIVNHPDAVMRCYRSSLVDTLTNAQLPFPRHLMVKTHCGPEAVEEGLARLGGPEGLWVKRGDVHATQPEDVQRVRDPERLRLLLDQFHARGITAAVLQEHLVGDEVKFYGVGGGRFFWWFYPKSHQGYPFDQQGLQGMAARAAETLGVEIYGGDAIVTRDGRLVLIDLNDWPTFAPCRGAAGRAIGAYLKEQLHALTTQLPRPQGR